VDLVVIGSGICGLSTALEARRRGLSVVVVDKEHSAAREASSRAQGSLRLQGREADEIPLAEAAIAAWRTMSSDADLELKFGGNAYLAVEDDEIPALRKLVDQSHAMGLTSVQLLDADETRVVIPAAKGNFIGAMYSPIDGQVNPEKASKYIFDLALEAGVRFCFGTKALKVVVKHERVEGVITDGPSFATPYVVVAAGVWTPYICATAGIRVPIMPVSMTTGETSIVSENIGPTIRSKGFSAKQRPNGCVVLDAGFSTTVGHGFSLYDSQDIRLWLPRLRAYARIVDPYIDFKRIVAEIRGGSRRSMRAVGAGDGGPPPKVKEIERAVREMSAIFPCVDHASISRCWVGVVDMSPDGLPILDADAGPGGLAFVAGLSGHGFTLGPAIGQVLTDLIVNRSSGIDVTPFRLARFDGKVPVPERMM
jgi:glycine/D-amino acid oxidase-like deaminating enzyme